jgi:RNA polymerase sigma-70 factor (ECF subfamily)
MEDVAQLTDEQLALLSINDQASFGVLMRRYEEKLLRYAKRLVTKKEDAEDILQEAFLKIYLNLNDFKKELRFSPWAYRITHNEAVSFLRRGGKAISLAEEDWNKIKSDLDLLVDVEKSLNREMLDICFKELNQVSRDILILRYLEERDYAEISDILRIPAGTVAVRINRAKKQLKEIYLKKYGK